MFSFPYFKQTIKSNFKFLCVFTLVLCAFIVAMTNVFTPETMTDLQSAMSETALKNILTGNGTLIGFMSNSFYALMAIIFPMVYSIIVGNRLIAEKIDKGNMAGFLSTGATRFQITVSSAVYFIVSLAAMWGVVSVVGIITSHIVQPDALDIKIFLMLNIGVLLYHLVISGICFCSSCIFNSSKYSLIFGAGIPLYFFVISMFIKLSDDLDFLRYITLNTLFNTRNILSDSGYREEFLAMGIISVTLYVIGIVWFQKKDLPL